MRSSWATVETNRVRSASAARSEASSRSVAELLGHEREGDGRVAGELGRESSARRSARPGPSNSNPRTTWPALGIGSIAYHGPLAVGSLRASLGRGRLRRHDGPILGRGSRSGRCVRAARGIARRSSAPTISEIGARPEAARSARERAARASSQAARASAAAGILARHDRDGAASLDPVGEHGRPARAGGSGEQSEEAGEPRLGARVGREHVKGAGEEDLLLVRLAVFGASKRRSPSVSGGGGETVGGWAGSRGWRGSSI